LISPSSSGAVAFGAIGAEVQGVEDGDEFGKTVLHLLAAPELVAVVEVGLVDDTLKVVGLGELADDLVDLVGDLLVAIAPDHDHVREAAALGHLNDRAGLAGLLVRDVLHEQEREDVVPVLRGVRAATQLVAAAPK